MQIYLNKYLETNAIRKLVSRLEDTNFIVDKYSSILSILEILSGIIDDESFILRQSIIKKVTKTRIKIDTDLPETKILKAFRFNFENTEVTEKFFIFLKMVGFASNYEHFIKTIQINKLENWWIAIKQYDDNAIFGFRKSIIENFSNYKKNNELIEQFKMRWDKKDLVTVKSLTIDFFSSMLFKNFIQKEKRTIKEIASSYDNSIDIYLICMAFYIDEKISYKNFPGSNDYLDINHLTYLYKNVPIIITDDKLLHKIMNKLFPFNILRISDI